MEPKCHAIASLCAHDVTFSGLLWNLVLRYVRLKGSKERYGKVRLLMSCSTFQESTTGVVEMLDDPPEAIKALINFIYNADYDVDDDQEVLDTILSLLDVFIIGQKYGLQELRDIAREEITMYLEERDDAAFEAFPDVAGAFEQLEIDRGCGWNINPDKGIYTHDKWFDWAALNHNLFMEDDEIWAAMLEKAPKLMEALAQVFFDEWERSGDTFGMSFVMDYNGPNTSGKLEKEPVLCPNRECRGMQTVYFLTDTPMVVACEWCSREYEAKMWIEGVLDPVDEINE